MMASSSEKTLPSPDSDSSKTTSPKLKFDALDFPGMKALEDFHNCCIELGEKMRKDPAYIQQLQELSEFTPDAMSNAKFDQEQLSNITQMYQRLRDNARQDPRGSLENLVKPGALEEFAERVAQIRKDPEVEPILAELDVCPAALLKFGDDKQVLKKLGKSMLRSQGQSYDDEEELVSEGRKALKIACGYVKMKCFKVILDSRRKKANKAEKKKKRPSHASKKHASKAAEIALQNSESQISPIDVATTSSMG